MVVFLLDRNNIEQVFLGFYSNLWNDPFGRNFNDVLSALPANLNVISPNDCEFLTREVSKNEIYQTLLSFSLGKSPGPNGLNAEFYQYFLE